ncbi:MAG: ABC transporter ATP-binding protein [Gaiellaceae bacterium MAG52_C11]|nr:ABC transporter ATP-binding protein [Candidatus Gaiellasilicea maunaloa]
MTAVLESRARSLPRQAILETRGLAIESRIGGRRRTIVCDLDLSVAAGETVGVVGESGSGKSMTARALIGLLPQGLSARGSISYAGRELLQLPERELARVRGSEIGLILQDPFTMLNPLLRCGRHITEVLERGDARGVSRRARRAEAVRRLAEVGIAEAVDRYPFELSGGMRQRVAIAAALAGDPAVLIADEPSTALDATTQKEILALLKSLQEARGMGLVLITHDLRVAFAICDRICVLYAGSLLETGGTAALEVEPLHPYTLGLLLSEPPGDRRLAELAAIPGVVPSPDDVAEVCSFSPRCPWAQPICRAGRPPLEPVAPGRLSACRRIDEIRSEMRQRHATVVQPAPPRDTPAVAAPLVEVELVEKVFGDTSSRRVQESVVALAGVSLEIGPHESVGLVGESGSGKTTLARCLVGLETPTSGRISIDGIDATDYDALSTADRRRLRRTVQVVFQDPYSSLNPVRSVGSTLREAIELYNPRSARHARQVDALLEQVGLPASYAVRKPIALSGGERQRVAIARALAVKPRLIVCDEPVSALDVSVQAQILNLLSSLREELGVGYLFITHDLPVVRQVVDRVYVLYRGEIVESGPVDEVIGAPRHPYTIRLVDSMPRSSPDWLAASAPPGAP